MWNRVVTYLGEAWSARGLARREPRSDPHTPRRGRGEAGPAGRPAVANCSPAIRRDALWANIAQARRFAVDDDRRQVGHPTDRGSWKLPPSSPLAYLDLQINELVLPAGFLQAPVFDPAASDAFNYGAMGSGLAHDLMHAIDATGSVIAIDGKPTPWWSETDRAAFAQRTACVVDQYEAYEVAPGVHHAGKQVPSLLGHSIKSGAATFGIVFAMCGAASTLLARTGTTRAVLAFLLVGLAHAIYWFVRVHSATDSGGAASALGTAVAVKLALSFGGASIAGGVGGALFGQKVRQNIKKTAAALATRR